MNFQYASDLHLEFDQNKKALSKKPLLPAAEILLLAGDIMPLSEIEQQKDFLNYISDHFKTTYWLPGNHEYFGADLADWPVAFKEAIRSNIFLLNNKSILLEDHEGSIQLAFTTLWSSIPPDLVQIVQNRMRDFKQIQFKGKCISAEAYHQAHLKSLEFLANALDDCIETGELTKDISVQKIVRKLVISHHLPSFLNYPKKHQNDPINAGFATDLDHFILKWAPNAWIFGHHHANIAPFLIGETKMFTNQLGYVKFKEDRGFDRQATLLI